MLRITYVIIYVKFNMYLQYVIHTINYSNIKIPKKSNYFTNTPAPLLVIECWPPYL